MFDEVEASLEVEGSEARKMFGHRCLTIGGKGFAIDFEDELVVKLAEPEHGRALKLEGSHLFDPMGGRPMKEWVQISAEHADDWLTYASAAMGYVQRLNTR